MTTQKRPEELARLRVLLGKLESGTTSYFYKNERGQLTQQTTAENIERIRLRIAELELSRNDNP